MNEVVLNHPVDVKAALDEAFITAAADMSLIRPNMETTDLGSVPGFPFRFRPV